MNGRRRALLPRSLVLLVLASVSYATVENDFSLYPQNSQSCLNQASDSSGCSGDTVMAMNSCLCNNGGNFVTNTAKCLGTSDVADVLGVYSVLSASCTDSKTPLNVEKAAFFSAAGLSSVTTSAASTSKASSTATNSATATGASTDSASGTADATPTNTGTQEGQTGGNSTSPGGLSGQARAGIIAASVCSGLALLGVTLFFFLRYRKRKESEESHPMLPHKPLSLGGPSIDGGPLPSSAEVSALGAGDDINDWPTDAKWRPTPGAESIPQPGGFNWESPYDTAPPTGWGRVPSAPPPEEVLWSAPPAPSKSPSNLSVAPSQVFELQGSAQPVEIAGTPVMPPGADKAYSGEGWGPGLGQKK